MANTEQKKDNDKPFLNTPIYRQTSAYAREHGERDQLRASNQANDACKKAIEQAISEHYAYNKLDPTAVKQVVEQFGAERTAYVLANTVKQKDWDERFSRSNRQWADTVPIAPNPDGFGGDRNASLVVNSHSVKTDLFITQARQDFFQVQAKDASRDGRTQRKPRDSVLAKLHNAASTAEQKRPAKLKEQER